jgi:hypothetical protein
LLPNPKDLEVLMTRKAKLYKHCHDLLTEQIEQAQQSMDDAQKDANSETKSSAGDKYETGRAMAQLDKERHATRKAMAKNALHKLQSTQILPPADTISIGSLITTNIGIYFIAVGLGKITFEEQAYNIISTESPLGQVLLDLEEDDMLVFRGKKITIKSIE